MSNKKEILVVGFGAVGVIYSYILKHGGKANVSCVARGNYEATLANGVDIQSRKYGNDIHGWKPDRLFRTVAEAADRPYSHAIIATKALPDIAPLPSLLAPLLSPDNPHPLPTFVILQNGLSVEKDLYNSIKKFGSEDPIIISTALWIGTNLLEGNIVDHGHIERLHVGVYRPTYEPDVTNTGREAAALQEFAELLQAGGSVVHIENEVQRIKFRKNFWNASIATCATLTNCGPEVFFRDPEMKPQVIPQIQAIMYEILAIGRAIGFDERALPSDVVDTTIQQTQKLYDDAALKSLPSMLIDLNLGRPMEIEVIVGELVRSAKKYHVDVPKLELVYYLLNVLQHKLLKKRE